MHNFKLTWGFFLISCLISCGNDYKQDLTPVSQMIPPFYGTIFLNPDIITDSDPSTFVDLYYLGQDTRRMYDRRSGWITVSPFLFNTNYDDGLSIEIQVNPEFQDLDTAKMLALKYAELIGKIPAALRRDVETTWIHKGINLFSGFNNSLLIHTGQSILYENDGILEETLAHEASHTSLDPEHSNSLGWRSAQGSDINFISTHARDFPKREDIAESFLLYMAIRYRSDRISTSLKDKILETIPNRILYFDDQNFNMYPIE
jgi:hypothetical protein